MVYEGNAYYFYKNLQGDVIAVTNAKGVEIARYSYDAWGVCTITGLTELGTASTFIDYQYGNYKIEYNNKMVKMRDIRWGSSDNIGDNGCGVIAAYNVFIGLGYDYMSFDKVLYQLSCMGAPLTGGLLGVNPTVLLDYMKIRFENVSLKVGGDVRIWNQTASVIYSTDI